MDKKKYFILFPPFLMLGIVLIIVLPEHRTFYAFLAIPVFWITYYYWIFIEKKKRKEYH
ncbi:hypothetical protein [Bacillus norwichensis]|uniref:Permease n=1 Tax=Bacillus norwichensis TaxID=2762217 RepID=A0ABR8VN83_9BACI|nr:hypothetical protein [Bacillus norwichensis]MBD8006227.1 hypothetical protein [Bacillus norwichensis]